MANALYKQGATSPASNGPCHINVTFLKYSGYIRHPPTQPRPVLRARSNQVCTGQPRFTGLYVFASTPLYSSYLSQLHAPRPRGSSMDLSFSVRCTETKRERYLSRATKIEYPFCSTNNGQPNYTCACNSNEDTGTCSRKSARNPGRMILHVV